MTDYEDKQANLMRMERNNNRLYKGALVFIIAGGMSLFTFIMDVNFDLIQKKLFHRAEFKNNIELYTDGRDIDVENALEGARESYERISAIKNKTRISR